MSDTRRDPVFDDAPGAAGVPARKPARSASPMLAALALLALIAAGWIWWSRPDQAPESTPATVPPVAMQQATPLPPPSMPAPAPEQQRVQASDVPQALAGLFGPEPVLRFLQTTDFPRRAVATLDNLGREHAPIAAWPVVPTPGRFLVDPAGSAESISEANARRYEPFVAFVAGVDAASAVDLYRRMYPLLQQAYRDLGFGDRALNDRVLEVIALLLATPEPAAAPEVALTEVHGPIPSASPWTRYEYTDPGLQQLAAGQKILLRVGPENRRRLKLKLQELRTELLKVSAPARQR